MIPTECEIGPCLIGCQNVVLMVMVNMPRDYHDLATHIHVPGGGRLIKRQILVGYPGAGDWQINVDATNTSTSRVEYLYWANQAPFNDL